jgi:hypothetical protein
MMEKSRVELHQTLVKFERSTADLIKKYPLDQDFMAAFDREADVITGQAAAEDRSWVYGQIGCILDEYGKPHEGYPPHSNR